MKSIKMLAILVLALGLTMCVAEVSEAGPIGTAFTYQGRLIDANSAADGEYDFQFKLFDDSNDPCSGNQLGSDVNQPDVDVIDGYFTVELDFGAGVFDGNAVWLETGVRPGDMNDPNAYTELSPRVELTPTPYALHTRWLLVDTALDNIFAGEDAGASNTTGSYNSAVGKDALNSNTEGVYNSAVGSYALRSNTTGNYNSAMGGLALRDNTTGNYNSAMGSYALLFNTEGNDSTAMGYQALFSNTTGSSNSAMGWRALYSNTTGSWNSAVGQEALKSNITGYENSAMGRSALYSNTEGYHNSAVGSFALYSNATGYHNSAMGNYALISNTTGYHNSAVGYRAGYSNSTGSGNVFLGYKAGFNETGSNKLYIANDAADANVLIYGDFSTGNVGIGTTSPSAKLDVEVTSGGAATIGSSLNSATGNYAIAMGYDTDANGDSSTAMGSDTTASGYASTAMGYWTTASGGYSTAMGRQTNASGGYSTAMGRQTNASNSYSTAMGYLTTASGLYSTAMGRGIEAQGHYSVAIALNDQNGEVVSQNNTMAIMGGNVGIGTTSPVYDLDVNGDIRAIGSVYYGGTEGNTDGTAYNKPDYVFEEGYDVMSIEQVEEYLKRQNHLPWLTSARQEKEENGDVIDMTRMAFETVETAENLQIQIIELNKRNKVLEKRIATLEKVILHKQFVSTKEVYNETH